MGKNTKIEQEFPRHVLEVKKELEASNDERLEVMQKLTEPRGEYGDNRDDLYIKMWIVLSENRLEYSPNRDNRWVYDFLDSVIAASTLPEHAYLSNEDRKDLMEKINKATESLVMVYENHGLNESIMQNCLFIESYNEDKGCYVIAEHMSINEVLMHYQRQAQEKIYKLANNTKTVNRTKSIRFIRELHDRIMFNDKCSLKGDTPLYAVLEGAEYAIYGNENDDGDRFNKSDISNLLTRTKRKKYASGISCF